EPGLLPAVLKRSRDTGAPLNITRKSVATNAPDSQDRYNPFDLALYADWLAEDRTVTAEMIESGKTDPYIELRIVNRIKQPALQEALPAVALLRRFDQQMLRPVIGETSLFEIYRQLGDQEWIDYQIDEAQQTSLLEVNRNLHPRLLDYYQHESRRHKLERARQQIAPSLIELSRHPLKELTSDHLDAALRLLDPADAAEVWENVVRRIPAERDWDWLQRVIARLRGEVGAIESTQHPLFPAVRAAEISAQIHLSPSANVAAAWSEVQQTADQHPDP